MQKRHFEYIQYKTDILHTLSTKPLPNKGVHVLGNTGFQLAIALFLELFQWNGTPLENLSGGGREKLT